MSLGLYKIAIGCFLVCTSGLVIAGSKSEVDSPSTSEYDFSASFLWDVDSYEPFFSNDSSINTTESEIRRIRFSFKTKHNQSWDTKIQLDYDPDKQESEFKDVYLSYFTESGVTFTVGQEKEPLGLEKINSLRKSFFIERTLVTQALAPGRNIGISIAQNSHNWFWKMGYYQPDTASDASKSKAITARVGWLPMRTKKNIIHLAISSSYRDLSGNKFRINERNEVHTAESVIEGKKIKAKNMTINAAEFIYQQKSLSLVAELLKSVVTDTKQREHQYSGGYWLVGYRLTGENHQYKDGKLGGLKLKKSNGAWEFTIRKSYFELKKEQQEIETTSFGINYYFKRSIKIMYNHLNSESTDKGIFTSGKADTFRIQYSF